MIVFRTLVIACAVLALLYGAVWAGAAWWVRDRLHAMAPSYAARGILFDPTAIRVAGFPQTFILSGAVQIGHTGDPHSPRIILPTVRVSTGLIDALWHGVYSVDLPDGIHSERPIALMTGPVQARLVVPKGLPRALDRRSLMAWRDQGGAVHIRDGTLAVGDSRAAPVLFDADLQLSGSMQPDITLDLRVNDLGPVLDLVAESVPDDHARTILSGLLRTVAGVVPQRAQSAIDLRMRVVDGRIFIGPMQLGFVPPIDWGDPLPVPDQ